MDVLIIDDDSGVRRVHQRVLERAGYMVAAVDNGLQALVELQEHEFAAILLDVQMPFLEGKSFFTELQASHPKAAGCVIFVTGWAGDPDVKAFIEQSGRPALQKPVEREALVNAVRQLIERPHSP